MSAWARSSSVSSSTSRRCPPSAGRLAALTYLRLTARKLVPNGRQTTGYSSPLLLWTVMSLTRSASLSRRTTCSSFWRALSLIWRSSQRMRACSPSRSLLAVCSSSARCKKLVSLRSPSGCCSQRAASPKRCSDWRSMASTPWLCQTACSSRMCWLRWSKASSSVARRCSSARLRSTLRTASAARTSSASAGVATPRSQCTRSRASSLWNTESLSDR